PPAGPVSFARVSGALLLCGHVGWVFGCGAADAGRFIFPNHAYGLPAAAFYGSAGVRAGLESPVMSPWLFLRTAVDLRAPIRPASYSYMGTTIFEVAGPSVGVSFGLLLEIPP